jgi:hypothetical protein
VTSSPESGPVVNDRLRWHPDDVPNYVDPIFSRRVNIDHACPRQAVESDVEHGMFTCTAVDYSEPIFKYVGVGKQRGARDSVYPGESIAVAVRNSPNDI